CDPRRASDGIRWRCRGALVPAHRELRSIQASHHARTAAVYPSARDQDGMRLESVMLDSLSAQAPQGSSEGHFATASGSPLPNTQSRPNASEGVKLSVLTRAFEPSELRGDPSVLIADVTHRSTEVRAGSLFFCVPGGHVDGHDYARAAVDSGATAVAVE